MKQRKAELAHLASLLDDEDEDCAVAALAELINHESELGTLPGELQESANPLVRRRAHQLQAALTLIRRRRQFRTLLEAPDCDIITGLLLIHLQWFDNDALPRIRRTWEEFAAQLQSHNFATLSQLAEALRREGMKAEAESTLKVEDYCLGTVINDRLGAGSILALLMLALAPENSTWRIVRWSGEFGVSDGGNSIVIPQRNWRRIELKSANELEFWEPRSLLLYAMSNLFSAAVNSDSFRYILTIAQALTGVDSEKPLEVLPYPYNPELESSQIRG